MYKYVFISKVVFNLNLAFYMKLLVFFYSETVYVQSFAKGKVEDIMLILFATVIDCHITPNSSLSCYKLYTYIFS